MRRKRPQKKEPEPAKLECQECGLILLEEESHLGRFSRQRGLCARCIVHEKEDKGEIEPPDCFGKAYDAQNFLCTDRCTLNQACLIQFTDSKTLRWEWEEHAKRPRKAGGFVYLCSRILRLVGRVLHVYDLAPLVESLSGGDYKIDNDPEYRLLTKKLRRRDDIAYLGDGFYIWFGYLNADNEGE